MLLRTIEIETKMKSKRILFRFLFPDYYKALKRVLASMEGAMLLTFNMDKSFLQSLLENV